MALLIIGDGDFSFSKSLFNYLNFDNRCTIIASCYEAYDEVISKYSQAESNIAFIINKGGFVKTSIDCTKLQLSDFDKKFDAIIFNFPHRGGKSNVQKNRFLLRDFFESVKKSGILSEYGTVCVSLCQGQAGTNIDVTDRDFGNSWQLEEMAAQSDYFLFDVRQFDLKPFGDYVPTGFRSQEKRFRLTGARTYLFVSSDYRYNSDLIDKITIDNRKFFCSSWVADYLNGFLTKNSLNDHLIRNLIESEKNYMIIKWCYGLKNSRGYKLSDVDGSECLSLCWSPWQQAVQIIFEENYINDGFTILTHGACFNTCEQSNEVAVEQYVVIAESMSCYETRDQHIPHCHLSDEDRHCITSNDITVLSETRSFYNNISCLDAILSKDNHTYLITVVNVTQYLRNQLSLSFNDSFIDILSIRRHFLWFLDQIFPTPFYDITFTIPNFLVEQSDVIRILAQRSHLDVRPYRDLSFWLPDPNMNVDNLLTEIAEICRCVFRRRSDLPLTLVDNYLNELTGARGICLRMPFRSGMTPLSRGMINELQTAVKTHCEQIFNVQLR